MNKLAYDNFGFRSWIGLEINKLWNYIAPINKTDESYLKAPQRCELNWAGSPVSHSLRLTSDPVGHVV
jgi:hypothetical protein